MMAGGLVLRDAPGRAFLRMRPLAAGALFFLRAALGILLASATPSPSWAQDGAGFYRGKTLRIVISTGVAGGFGEYARLLSEHIGGHIAGRPHVIVQSMPGAGGLLAANYLYASAPQDGTTIGIINSTVPLAPLWGSKGARFDSLKFNWLGTLDRAEGVCTLWHTSPVKTWADMLAKELTVGSIGAGSEMELYPAMLNKLFATRIKVIAGYKAGSDIDLAIERGELDGRCGTHLTSFKALHPRWFAERKIVLPIIIAERRRGEFPDTPAVMEFVRDEETRQQLQLMMVAQTMDRPVLAPPGVPGERVEELRAALDATMSDPAFRADIEKRSLHIDPMRGADMMAAYARAFAFPPEIVAAVREVMGGK
jgi:tripartite-type tricarboxylate transporter receptor subunit TctC